MSKKNHPNLLALRGYSYYEQDGIISRLAWLTDLKDGDLSDMVYNKGIFKTNPL